MHQTEPALSQHASAIVLQTFLDNKGLLDKRNANLGATLVYLQAR